MKEPERLSFNDQQYTVNTPQKLRKSLDEMMQSAREQKAKDEMQSLIVRKSLADDLFVLAANAMLLPNSNEAEECIIAEVQTMLKNIARHLGYASIAELLINLREKR